MIEILAARTTSFDGTRPDFTAIACSAEWMPARKAAAQRVTCRYERQRLSAAGMIANHAGLLCRLYPFCCAMPGCGRAVNAARRRPAMSRFKGNLAIGGKRCALKQARVATPELKKREAMR